MRDKIRVSFFIFFLHVTLHYKQLSYGSLTEHLLRQMAYCINDLGGIFIIQWCNPSWDRLKIETSKDDMILAHECQNCEFTTECFGFRFFWGGGEDKILHTQKKWFFKNVCNFFKSHVFPLYLSKSFKNQQTFLSLKTNESESVNTYEYSSICANSRLTEICFDEISQNPFLFVLHKYFNVLMVHISSR